VRDPELREVTTMESEPWDRAYRSVEKEISKENNSNVGRWINCYLAGMGIVAYFTWDHIVAMLVLAMIAALNLGVVFEHRSRLDRAFTEDIRRNGDADRVP
jgi:hypothetical protein